MGLFSQSHLESIFGKEAFQKKPIQKKPIQKKPPQPPSGGGTPGAKALASAPKIPHRARGPVYRTPLDAPLAGQPVANTTPPPTTPPPTTPPPMKPSFVPPGTSALEQAGNIGQALDPEAKAWLESQGFTVDVKEVAPSGDNPFGLPTQHMVSINGSPYEFGAHLINLNPQIAAIEARQYQHARDTGVPVWMQGYTPSGQPFFNTLTEAEAAREDIFGGGVDPSTFAPGTQGAPEGTGGFTPIFQDPGAGTPQAPEGTGGFTPFVFEPGPLPTQGPGSDPIDLTPTTQTSPPGSPDEVLAYGAGDIGYLRNIAENAGFPVNVSPAWQAMVEAQERNIDRRFADLMEAFNVSGGRFSTDFGSAATDFQNQAALEQNALLGGLQLQALENAAQRELGAASQLGQFGFGGLQQLSAQDFQAQMQQDQQAYDAITRLTGDSNAAAQLMSQFGAQGALALLGISMDAASQLYGGEQQAALAESQFLNAMAPQLSRLWMQNLLTGSQLGGQQYGLAQNEINRAYQEWLRIQPQYNPLLPYLFAGATQGTPVYFPQYRPPAWLQALGAAGNIAGAIF